MQIRVVNKNMFLKLMQKLAKNMNDHRIILVHVYGINCLKIVKNRRTFMCSKTRYQDFINVIMRIMCDPFDYHYASMILYEYIPLITVM